MLSFARSVIKLGNPSSLFKFIDKALSSILMALISTKAQLRDTGVVSWTLMPLGEISLKVICFTVARSVNELPLGKP